MLGLLIRILKGVIEHWIVSLLAVSGTAVGGWFLWLYGTYLKDWLLSTWHVEMPGWVWLFLFLAVFLLLVLFIYIMFDRFKNPDTIRSVLSELWDRHQKQNPDELRFTLYFLYFDKKGRLQKGSAEKYLREIVTKDGVWSVIRESPDTLLIEREPLYTQPYTC